MKTIDEKIIETLIFIQENPNYHLIDKNGPLDEFIVHDLISRGLIDGFDNRDDDTLKIMKYSYTHLNINLNGMRLLEPLNKQNEECYLDDLPKEEKPSTDEALNWRKSPIVQGAITIVVLVFVAIVLSKIIEK